MRVNMTKNYELETFIKQEIALNDSEIFSIDFQDKKYWIKYGIGSNK